MIDTASETQEAFFQKLVSTPGVTNLAPVWQAAPENSKPPLIVIGAISLEPIGGKDGGLDRATVEILTFSIEPDQTVLFGMQAAIRNALEDQPISTAVGLFSNPAFIASQVERGEDGETYIGTQKFETIVQPKD